MPPSASPAPGIVHPGTVHANLSAAALVQAAVRRKEGELTAAGALACKTGKRTGRSPKDKFVARELGTESSVHWGPVNQPMPAEAFNRLADLVRAYLQHRELFTFDGAVGADPRHRLRVRVVSETAWHTLFARCLFLRDTRSGDGPLDFARAPSRYAQAADWTILHAPNFHCDPARDGTNTEAAVAISFAHRLVIVAGTHYAGEIKKSAFTVMNYLLPGAGVFPMHCSANVGPAGDVALFFGLSGTGKTTLSADPARRLIGDDEHGWSDDGVFNIEGGCYAKTIRLSAKGEPQIWNAIKFGCVLENVPVDPATGRPDYDSDALTENTRAAYPVDFIPNCELSGVGGHPKNIFFLTCDAFGVLPPIARLTPAQAVDYFLCGYTAKIPGTEVGVTEPGTTFSTCFAAPFLPLAPKRYAELLKAKLDQHGVPVWLVNTGWTGGPYGVGKRMSIAHTRALLTAALDGKLAGVEFKPDPVFGIEVPTSCPGVPAGVLTPRGTWPDPAGYDKQAAKLAGMFAEARAKHG